jgi:hypothetical protein
MAKSTKKAVTKSKKTTKTTTAKKTTKKAVAKKPSTKTKSETTHILAVLDRSGSMSSVVNDAIGGYNTFIGEQKKLKDKATLSGTLFDDRFEGLNGGQVLSINDVPELNRNTFVPRGSTALYDAIGKTINAYKTDAANKADKVLVIVITDGHENASKEYSARDISDLITHQKKQNWQFVFLCSTEDAITVGASLGVSGGNTLKFTNTGAGNVAMYATLNKSVASFRSMSLQDSNYAAKADSLIADNEDDQ